MKIGVWVNGPIDKHSGGTYSYVNTLITGIDNFNFNKGIDIVFLSADKLSGFNKPSIHLKPHLHGISFFSKATRKLLKLISSSMFKGAIDVIDQKEKNIKDANATSYLKKQGVGVIFYPLPASRVIDGMPFILNNWDLAHYTIPAFPEITGDDGFQKRNDWYVTVMPYALMVFCETETGKAELVQYLNINPDKVKILPIFCSDTFVEMQLSAETQTGILKQFTLQEQQFFFYPAQFWAHKNHYNLVNAFQKFNEQYPDYKLFFCGSDKGNLTHIKNHVKALGMDAHVIFGGFIDERELYTLYKNARALIMPTFLGPSNIPPIEAMHLQCPALLSGLQGHREIMNNAALYFNPQDYLSILESMKLIMDDSTRLKILHNQSEQLKITQHTIEKALIKLEAHFIEALNIRNCWE